MAPLARYIILRTKTLFLTAILSFGLATSGVAQTRGYLRQPDLHGTTLVFVAEGDLWTTDLATSDLARRLTSHPGEELHPSISPDGSRIAFSASYQGTSEVYVMPLAGGVPRQLTWHGGARVSGWTPDGWVLYATTAFSTLPDTQLVRVDPMSLERRPVPLAQAADGAYDAAGERLVFTREEFQGSHSKRYRGGTAQSLWSFSQSPAETSTDGSTRASEAVELTADYPGTNREPMWWGERVVFVSDRGEDDSMNLWSMTADGGDLRQHTHHRGWDVQEPELDGTSSSSVAPGRVIYRLGADLRLHDLVTGEDRELAVFLASDLGQQRERWIDNPFEFLTAVHLSADGEHLALTARGEVFVAPVHAGRRVHVTRQPGVRYRSARFVPQVDGSDDRLVALSDESGEVEWWTLPANGIGERRQVTRGATTLRFDGVVSPDGTWIAHVDRNRELWLTHLADGESRQVAQVDVGWESFLLPAFSPDSRWLAYTLPGASRQARLYLYEISSATTTPLTSDRYHSFDPAWSADGKWLYFLSERHFESVVPSPWSGTRQPDPYFDKRTKIYALALDPEARFPFHAADELEQGALDAAPHPASNKEPDAASGGADKVEKEPIPAVEIVRGGLAGRLWEVPVEPENRFALAFTGKRLTWLRAPYAAGRGGAVDLMSLEIEPEAEPARLAEGVAGYELSADGSKLLVRKQADERQNFWVVDAAASAPLDLGDPVDLSGWSFPFDPREEWRQMLVDAWRLYRDYFYDPGMHGLDWQAILDKYLPLVDRVTTRAELADLMAQMVAEPGALHTFVVAGDVPHGPENVEPAFLGAHLERDAEAGGYRVIQLYRTDPELPGHRGPLLRPGAEVREGDVLIAINGVSTLEVPPGQSLRRQAGQQVRLRVGSGRDSAPLHEISVERDLAAERDLIVEPLSAREAADLRYSAWEHERRLRVESASKGTMGYVHLRAMGSRDIAAWAREFPPIFHRQGLIVDMRHNRGGNIDSWVLGKLVRSAWFYWQNRRGEPYWNMQRAFRGHMVVLVDGRTASDGEAFAEGFRRLGLGPVIGMRTWGGEIWLSSSNVLVDGGIATAPESGVYGPEGEWLIEGHGVDPDIVVDNLPYATYLGKDAQLERAIEVLRQKIRDDPRLVPPAPPYPDVTRE